MSYNIVITPAFERDIKPLLKKYRSLKNDLRILFENLDKEPRLGIPIGQDCYKIRLAVASKNKGKTGGARVITCVKISAGKVFLLTIYDKSDKGNISDNELKELLRFI